MTPEQFTERYESGKSKLFGNCMRIVNGDTDLAEDLLQDSLVQGFKNRHQFREEATFTTWMYRIALNVYLQDKRRKRCDLLSYDAPTLGEDMVWMDKISRYDGNLMSVNDKLIILDALSKLNPCEREAFILSEMYGFDHGEIAKMKSRKIAANKSNLHRARYRMREALTA